MTRFLRSAAAVLLLWILLPLAGVEVLMTALEPWLFRGFYKYDRQIGFRVRPGAGGSNALGFNDRDYPPHKPSGGRRVLFLGDSFSWCGGRDGNYTALLEEKFAREPFPVEIINAGFPMTHTGEELALLETFSLPYDPDVVVLAFYAGNDFYDADPNRKRIVVNDLYIDIDPRREWVLFGRPIVARSRLWTFLQQKLRIHQALAAGRGTGVPGETALFSEEEFLGLQAARMDFCDLRTLRAGLYRDNIAFVEASLKGMAEFVRSRGKRFAVVIIPAEFQVDPRLQEKLFGSFGLRREDYDLTRPQTIVRGALEPLDVPVVDLMPRFAQEEREAPHYVFGDGHWNRAGNRLAADVLFEELSTLLLSPG